MTAKRLSLYAFVLELFVASLAHGADPVPLSFSLITSFGEFGYNSSPSVPAIEVALDRINQTQVLPGYRLQYTEIRNSQVRNVGMSCVRVY